MMDKYTVDLDKVLNDFEYSELTDNFGSSRAYLAQGASSYASSSKSRSGDAKHSITNVFHSLNEYLSTDVSVNPKQRADVADSNKENVVQNSAFSYADKYDGFEVTTGNLLDLNFAEEPPICDEPKGGGYVEIAQFLSDDKDCEDFCDNKLEEDEIEEIGFGATAVSGHNHKSGDDKVPDATNGNDLECTLRVEKMIEVKGINEHNLNETGEAQSEINEIKSVPIEEFNEHNLERDIANLESASILTDEHNLGVGCDEHASDFNDKVPEEVSNGSVIKTDSILRNCSDVDAEGGTPNLEIEIPNLDENFSASKDDFLTLNDDFSTQKDPTIANDDPPNFKDIPNSTETSNLPNLKVDLAANQNDLADPKNDESSDNQAASQTEAEATIVRYDDTVEIDDSALNKFLDDLEEEFESENTDTKAIADDSSEGKNEIRDAAEGADSVERPSLLRLASGSEDDAKRQHEINLIGEPGSTPYNNVYVTRELGTEDVGKEAAGAKEKESSVSPTFSEASTDTVSDSSDAETDQRHASTDVANALHHERHDDQTTQSEEGVTTIEESVIAQADGATSGSAENDPVYWLGKQAPLWIPDSEALSCLHCDTRFTVIKRRHHCRACGLVLCSKCCNLKYRLEYLDAEARVCLKCYGILNRDSSSSEVSPSAGNSPSRQPNPNNPMEYCSVVPPLQQVGNVSQNPPTVMVPVGVLKRKGSNKKSNKSVMFCDGIRPGSDLTKLDTEFDAPAGKNATGSDNRAVKTKGDTPKVYQETHSFVPKDSAELPPLVTVCKSETTYFCNKYKNDESLLELLKTEKLTFAFQKNIFVHVKIIDLSCCINKRVWCFLTEGFLSVGQDEIMYLIEFIENETCVPVDIFNHLNIVYNDALKGTTVTELGISLHDGSSFLDFKNHAGFLYIRPTFQCVQNIIKPNEPYLVGLLIHRWETPWAKVFPLRLVLRLGAEYRYYPSPLISTRYRDSLFVELGHTIITILADFRNFSYTLPNIRGLTIHMQDKNTTVNVPPNRYDQVMSSLNNSSDHILALGGNFSMQADSHLVCIQDTQSSTENAYTTHAINIQKQPRKVTGASFIVFNGALKSTSGLTAKSSIVEDGLMIQIPPEDMTNLRESLRNMKNYTIQCGCVNAPSDETVNIVWGDMDNNFNIGVVSPIDNQPMSGVPSIRVHNGKNYTGPGHAKMIRWTEVFILQNTDEKSKARDPLDISKISEIVAKATCTALVKYLDLLCSNNFFKIGIRTTLHVENVSYSAGSNNVKLPPIYMKSLDNELIPVLHRIVSNNLGDDAVTLELIFRILNS